MKLFSILLFPFFLLLLAVAGCGDKTAKKPTNWNKDYKRISKNPYSLQLTYASLPMLFPQAKMEQLKESDRLNNLGYETRQNKAGSLLVMIVPSLSFTEEEIDSLVTLVQEGNQVLLVSNNFDEQLLTRLKLSQIYNEDENDSLQKLHVIGENHQMLSYNFRFKKEAIQQQFNNLDTAQSYFSILGTNQKNQPNFISFRSGKGRLLLHSAPIAFSNYFLLQGNNREYLKNVFSFVDEPVSNIYFYSLNERIVKESSIWELLQNKALLMAFILSLIALAVFIGFEMRRRQKIIPILKPIGNSSVAFTETIGRLYYNNKNHTNLAEKMAQHFLEFVRSNYYLNTNILDAEFVRLLAAKSGKDIAITDSLIYNIKMVHNGLTVDEAFLFALYTQIQDFYNGK